MNNKELNHKFQNIVNEQIEKDIMGSYNLTIPNTNTGVSITCTPTSKMRAGTVSISSFSKGHLMHTYKTTEQISEEEAQRRGEELAALIEPHFQEIGKAYEEFLNKYNYQKI